MTEEIAKMWADILETQAEQNLAGDWVVEVTMYQGYSRTITHLKTPRECFAHAVELVIEDAVGSKIRGLEEDIANVRWEGGYDCR